MEIDFHLLFDILNSLFSQPTSFQKAFNTDFGDCRYHLLPCYVSCPVKRRNNKMHDGSSERLVFYKVRRTTTITARHSHHPHMWACSLQTKVLHCILTFSSFVISTEWSCIFLYHLNATNQRKTWSNVSMFLCLFNKTFTI